MVAVEIVVKSQRCLVIVEEERGRTGQRTQRHREVLTVAGERCTLVERRLRGGQVVQERLHLGQVTGCGRENLATGFSRRAVERGAGTELAIAPSLIRSEEERAIQTADVAWTTFAETRQMEWTTERAAHLVFNPERRVLSRFERRIRITETGALVGVAASVKGVAVVEPEERAVIVVGAGFGDGVEY